MRVAQNTLRLLPFCKSFGEMKKFRNTGVFKVSFNSSATGHGE
jgi:hypothetical protein